LTRRSSSFMDSYLLAATVATRAAANFICVLFYFYNIKRN
jgi:hypothetical protein